jgi:hypothetical protein
MANERHPKHQRLLDQLLQPTLFTESRSCQTTVEESSRLAVDQGFYPELLGEALQLSRGGGALLKIDEVGLDPSLGKEAKRFPGVGAFLYAEYLDFHGPEL